MLSAELFLRLVAGQIFFDEWKHARRRLLIRDGLLRYC